MKAIKTAFLRSNTKEVLEQVAGGETFIIARPANQNAVLLSEEAYNEMLEAAALAGAEDRARTTAILKERLAYARQKDAEKYSHEQVREILGL